ncbi:MAG: GAF domain-containing protein [Gammaproteobacteria bacterium]|nr:GAF domain-containing protein [Gammaproteobacteria bacterium]
MHRTEFKPTLVLAGDCDDGLAAFAHARGWTVLGDGDVRACNATVVLVGARANARTARRRCPHGLIVSQIATVGGVDLTLPKKLIAPAVDQLLAHAECHWRRSLKVETLVGDLDARRTQIRQISEIGIALSSRMKLSDLLATILTEARRISECDAGSLYLIEDLRGKRALVFKLTQNDSIDVPFVDRHMPVSSGSLAGYVAQTGEELNIEDVYEISAESGFRFNRSFDDQMGYRTRSALVLPMRDHRNKVIGVLQFLNKLDGPDKQTIAFGDEAEELLRAVASQAAVSIQKNMLINDISHLFESFVLASVKAIEKRDPSTSGHSFRVAGTTVALMEALPKSGFKRFAQLQLSSEHLREVRYAALLHDFGKVSVSEDLLKKADKISNDRLEVIRYRIELAKERLRRLAVEKQLLEIHEAREDFRTAGGRIKRELERQISVLDDYMSAVISANKPTVLADGDFAHLQTIRAFAFHELDGTAAGLISDADLLALSVRRGSLTADERRSIQSHVVHTREFLAELPWPDELAQVPQIAGAHHEKLDGSGYPDGLTAEQIPLPSRVMTVCDIYDALTANDRPYKSAVSVEVALDILRDEADAGLLDRDVVQIFMASRSYALAPGAPIGPIAVAAVTTFAHHSHS